MSLLLRLLRRLTHTAVLLLLVAIGTLLLLRFAPGYLADAREMDPRYAASARAELQQRASFPMLLHETLQGFRDGSFGTSASTRFPSAISCAPGSRSP